MSLGSDMKNTNFKSGAGSWCRWGSARKYAYARVLRKSPTPAEKKLWEALRGKALGPKFRRQCVMLGWIVDFYCPSGNLIIEIDGTIHEVAGIINEDHKKDEAFLRSGLKVLRFKNEEILGHLEETLRIIKRELDEKYKPPL